MKFSTIFTDHMILQRNKEIAVWGTGMKDTLFEVSLGDDNIKGKVDSNGRWNIIFPARGLGEPLTMTLSSAGKEKCLTDILMGDIWLCSGQSNMEWPIFDSKDAQKEIENGNHPLIRLVTIRRNSTTEYQTEANCQWQVCSSETLSYFSAVGYSFGRALQQELNIPIGLINSSWGGTQIEGWMSLEGLQGNPESAYLAEAFQGIATRFQKSHKEQVEWDNEYLYAEEPHNDGFDKGWHQKDFSDTDWKEMLLPQLWQEDGKDFNGSLWFRKKVKIPKEWLGKELEVSLGACDKTDVSYANGELLGSLSFSEDSNSWMKNRLYDLPGKFVCDRDLQIAVRVVSMAFGGGMSGPKENMFLKLKDDDTSSVISLAGNWKYKIENKLIIPPSPQKESLWGDRGQKIPSTLFAGMINPITPLKIKGIIWYQGESNCRRAKTYLGTLPALINDWRQRWREELPFYIVQLTNYKCAEEVGLFEDGWPELREAQRIIAKNLNHCEMVCTIDIGDPSNIHPKNKQSVGARLSQLALKDCYLKSLHIYKSPEVENISIQDTSIIITFSQAAGLHCKGDEILGFEISGSNNDFMPAKATIDGETILVTAEEVPSPQFVRFAWRKDPEVNVFNNCDLPLAPFNTSADLWVSESYKIEI
ncbi:MAG: hypothetical protein KAI74_04410 [Kiritimatiellae bacterium]|nr:hypothetical protein [Kiritimatiellia bacterium]